MEKIDLRTLSAEGRKEIRQTAVRLYKKGHRKSDIAATLGLRRATVGQWISTYEKQGTAALKEVGRGRPAGKGRSLTPEQEVRMRHDIVEHTPDQLKMEFALWNVQRVRSVIRLSFGVDMPVRTVRSYLKRWGFTPLRPLKRAYEQKPELVQKWLAEEYPAIVERAKAEGAEIHWGDETAVFCVEDYPFGYEPQGEMSALTLSRAKHERVSLISSISNQGKVRFMLHQESVTADVMIRFLERLIRDSDKRIFLILDNRPVYHSKQARAWLAGKEDLLELYLLPGHVPEQNPDEYLSCDMNASSSRCDPSRGKGPMKKLTSQLRSIQKCCGRMWSLFETGNIRYAAA